MMKTNLKISIAEPCTQNWDGMRKQTAQKFCEVCSKCVVDFSTHSNAEIITALKKSTSEICGRLSESQLNQINYHLMLAPKNKTWMKYLGILAIGVGLFNPVAMATLIKNHIELKKHFTKIKDNEKKPSTTKVISGYVLDENKMPLVGVRIVIQNTKLFALTNKHGQYSIKLKDGFDRSNNRLEVESLRYNGYLKINYNQQTQSDFMLARSESMIMGKMIMVKEPRKSL